MHALPLMLPLLIVQDHHQAEGYDEQRCRNVAGNEDRFDSHSSE